MGEPPVTTGVPDPVEHRRILVVHAHPDDETITTGGTIAHYAARGADVRVVTCTLGEEGEVLDSLAGRWSGLVAAEADQLGGYRIGELTAALSALGTYGPTFLGGAGAFRDSGMAGTPSAEHPRAFVNSGDRAVEALIAEIESFAPDVVVTYDPDGGYGHPDHIRAHEITHEAVGRAQHAPRRLAWTVTAPETVTVLHSDPPAGLRNARPGELPVRADHTTRVDLDDHAFRAKLAALAAHRTQLEVVDDPQTSAVFFALTNHVLQPVDRSEYYVCFDVDPRTRALTRARPGGGL